MCANDLRENRVPGRFASTFFVSRTSKKKEAFQVSDQASGIENRASAMIGAVNKKSVKMQDRRLSHLKTDKHEERG